MTPNLLVVTIDDMRFDELRYMPHLRRIAQAGTTFSRQRTPMSQCSPYRALLQSGVLGIGPNNSGVASQNDAFLPHQQRNALPVWLQAAGYHTGQIGKYFTAAQSPSLARGWDWLRTTANPNHSAAFDFGVWDGTETVVVEDLHQDAWFARELSGFVTTAPAPWHLWLCTNSPHTPLMPSERHQDRWSGVQWPDRSAHAYADAPTWVRARAPYTPEEVAAMRADQRNRLRELSDVDDLLGMLWQWMLATEAYRDTVLFVQSDNGNSMGEHRTVHNSKNQAYDWSTLVPLFIAGADWPAGVTVDAPTMVPDLTVTLAAMAGATLGRDSPGIDLREVLDSPADFSERHILGWNSDTFVGGLRRSNVRWVVRGETKLIHNEQPDGGYAEPEDEFELYDLDTDPYELENRAWDPKREAERDELAALIGRWLDL